MYMSRRVVITGMGLVTPLGCDIDAVWASLLRGDSAIGPVTRYDASTSSTNFAAEVKGFSLADHAKNPQLHDGAGLNTQFAIAAATKAWQQAGLDRFAQFNGSRMGAYLGAGEGSLDFDNFVRVNIASWRDGSIDDVAWAKEALACMTVRGELEQEPNIPLAHLATRFQCQGPAFNCMTACAASTQAVGEAFEIIRRGDADLMFAGGSHSMIHPLGMTGFIRLTAMSTRRDTPTTAARPFDSTREGFVMGEGAGILVLEEEEHALRRGATPIALVAGFGSSADAFRITDIQPEGRGAQLAMKKACEQASISPRDVSPEGRPAIHYISAHGTGTKENDRIETAAVKGLFGPLAPRIPFSSVKSMLGHLIQAAGAVELITCVQAIKTGFVPPTMNLASPDPECDLDYVPNVARDLNPLGGIDTCLSNSFGFGGQNDTLCIRRYRPA